MTITVFRESTTTASRNVSPTFGKRDGTQVLVDYSEPLPVVDVNHYRLHEGRAFLAYYLQNGVAPLADAASINIAIAANAGYAPHITIGAFCGGGESLEFVIKPLTNYLIRLTNISGSAQTAEVALEWYE